MTGPTAMRSFASGPADAADSSEPAVHAPIGAEGGMVSASTEASLRTALTAGRPLDDEQRAPMESAFGADFSGVRMHTEPSTDQLADDLGAAAFTVGSDVFVRSSDWRPGTPATTSLLAHELTHTLQQGQDASRLAVQRVVLDHAALRRLLRGVQGLRDLFTNDDTINPQQVSVTLQAERMMKNYEAMFEASAPSDEVANAMKLAAAARVTGAMLARRLNNPWLAPELSKKLLEYYEPSLRSRLRRRGVVQSADRSAIMTLATVVASADPVKLFMTDKISEVDAVRKIQQMAADAGCTATQMFTYVSQQFQMELRSFSADEIRAGTIGEGVAQDAVTQSGEADLIGELSSARFHALVNTALAASGRSWAAVNGAGNALDFTAPAAAKLQALQLAVAAAPPFAPRGAPPAGGPGAAALSDRQKWELADVEAADAAVGRARVESEILAALRAEFGVDLGQAARLLKQFIDNFSSLPLTTTFGAANMFGANVPGPLVYQNAMKRELQNVDLHTLFPNRKGGQQAVGAVEQVGVAGGMATHRGNRNYVRWRYEKDVKPPGYDGLSIAETFEFGALSPSFAAAKGADVPTSFGENQYGESHVVYKDQVKDRAMYQFTAKGALRRDPLLLLHDIAVTAPSAVAAVRADHDQKLADWQGEADPVLKAQRKIVFDAAVAQLNSVRSKALQADNVLKAIFAAVSSQRVAFLDQQQIEVRILGQIDFATDAKELHIGPSMTQNVKDNAQNFAARNGIAFSVLAPGPTALRANAVYGQGHSPEVNADVAQHVTAGKERKGRNFDALASIVLGIRRVALADQVLFATLVHDVGALYNALGRSKTRARQDLWTQVQAHAPAFY